MNERRDNLAAIRKSGKFIRYLERVKEAAAKAVRQ